MSYGLGGFGFVFFGGTPLAAPLIVRELADFQFNVRAKSEGYAIRIEWSVPAPADAPDWDRRLRILRKQGEWPQSWDDSGALVVVDDTFPTLAQEYWLEQTEMQAGVIYYYALFAQRIDGAWIHDRSRNRSSAYPYDRWGCVDYMYSSLPPGFRVHDAGVLHLYQFLSILGALIDNAKTDAEHLLTLMEIDSIHEDLIPLLDAKIGWPTWLAAGGLQRRQDTRRAVDLYKILGTTDAYEQMLESVSDWEATIVEGWRYVMFSNGRFGSTTPDFTNPDTTRLMGRIDDILKYVNDTNGWHSVNGLGFFLEEIPGVSDALTSAMISRFLELIEWGKASFVNYGVTLLMSTDEVYPLEFFIVEETDEILSEIIAFEIEELSWTTTSWSLFESTDLGSTTNTLSDRTYHDSIEYL